MAAALGVALFIVGFWGSRRYRHDSYREKFFFWVICLGAAYIDVSLFALRASPLLTNIGGTIPAYVAWGYTAMIVVICGAKTFLPKSWQRS